jgi:hypothetical protein
MRAWVLALALAAVGPGSLNALTVTRGPFLALGGPMSMLVVWRTDEPVESAVESGLTAELGQMDSDPAPKTDHAVLLTDLSADTVYHYRVRGGGQALSEVKSFRTSPDTSAEAPGYRFVAFGDSGGGTQAQLDVAGRIALSSPDFGIHVGDLVYAAKDPGDLDSRYFSVYRDTIARAPFYIALGNKEVDDDGGAAALEAFHLPENSPAPERYYSFVHGNALFIALDTNAGLEAGGAQLAWLEETLGQSDRLWKLVFFHHPIHTSATTNTSHGERLEPIFDAHRVDVVFQGHTHHYERTFPIAGGMVFGAGGEPDYVDPPGRIYIVTGGGGGSLISDDPKPFAAHYRSTHHHLELDVGGNVLRLGAIDSSGVKFDAMSITKTGADPSSPFRRGDSDGEGNVNITDAVRTLNVLFLGLGEITCLDAADTDDDGTVNLTDAIRTLNVLFLGLGEIPAPGTAACGIDPTADDLACAAYGSCGS